MLIQCTSCKTTARLSDDKEGAKVRCPSCGHVYVARPAGSRGSTRSKSNNTQLMIFGGAGIVGVIMMYLLAFKLEMSTEPRSEVKALVDSN